MSNEILRAQVRSLSEDLDRITTLLNEAQQENRKPGISKEFIDPVAGKFATRVSDLKDNASAATTWEALSAARREVQELLNECLAWLGGIAVRELQLETGICRIAEGLVREYVRKTGAEWRSIMILGEERPFDNLALVTKILRVPFPKWDIWNLPLIMYDFGNILSRESALMPVTTRFFADERTRIADLVQNPKFEDDIAKRLSKQVADMRTKFQRDGKPDLNNFLVRQENHIRSLFADMSATYFLGPAYVYSQFLLHLNPTEVQCESFYKPPFERRAAAMLKTLEAMIDADKKQDEEAFAGVLERVRHCWNDALGLPSGQDLKFDFGYPFDNWFDGYKYLHKYFPRLRFSSTAWNEAKKLEDNLKKQKPEPPPQTTIQVILNGAWYCRLRLPEGEHYRIPEIERTARLMIDKVQPTLERTQISGLPVKE